MTIRSDSSLRHGNHKQHDHDHHGDLDHCDVDHHGDQDRNDEDPLEDHDAHGDDRHHFEDHDHNCLDYHEGDTGADGKIAHGAALSSHTTSPSRSIAF